MLAESYNIPNYKYITKSFCFQYLCYNFYDNYCEGMKNLLMQF